MIFFIDLLHTHIHTNTQACPFELEVFTDSCEGEIEIIDILNSDPEVSAALCRVAVERGVCESVGGEVGKGGMEGGGGLLTYTYITPHLATIVVENKVRNEHSVFQPTKWLYT